MHLREIFYGTLIFQQSSMICIGRRVGGHQGSQICQIWRILHQNCSDDSTEVTEGVTSTPEIFGNKHSFVLTFFATNTIYVNYNRCKSSKLKNYTARQNRKRVNYDQSLLDDRHHGFELSTSADRHS